MIMKQKKIKKGCAYFLLLYFLFFVVPPLSSIVPSADVFALSGQSYSLGEQHKQNKLYLFDLTLWEILKRGKRSETLSSTFLFGNEDHEQRLFAQLSGIAETGSGMRPFLATKICQLPINRILRSSGFQFTHSGLSPPVIA